MSSSAFLTATWRKLIIVNYEVAPSLLLPYVPRGTELDLCKGSCYVSLIGFLFGDVRLKGWRIPFHRNFEEVNLRFYVRHVDAGGVSHRGVVFLQELVPRLAVSLIANTFYGESYRTRRTRHVWTESTEELQVRYEWRWQGVETDLRSCRSEDGGDCCRERGGVHHGALLGIYPAECWEDLGISDGASPMGGVPGRELCD